MATITSVEAFLEVVRKAGVVEEACLNDCLAQLPPEATAAPLVICRSLIKAGILTRYQASQLLQGKYRGFIISGQYRLLDRLGAGGMGHVYLCEHLPSRRRVALKVLPAAHGDDPSNLERFEKAARAAATLDHPHIVRTFAVEHDGRMHVLVTEYVEGSTLLDLVAKAGPLPLGTASHYIWQAARGLQEAHAAGLIHTDIKPSNLLVDRKGNVKILDMGTAGFFHDDDGLARRHDSNSLLGTTDYHAPEQTMDGVSPDIRADIYGLGATLYFLLTGQSPLGSGSVMERMLRAQHGEPVSLAELRPDLPPELVNVVATMMARDPDDRYPTPTAVVSALAIWAAERDASESDTDLGRLPRRSQSPDSTLRIRAADDTFTGDALAPWSPLPEPLPPNRFPWLVAALLLGIPIGAGAVSWWPSLAGQPTMTAVNDEADPDTLAP